jgi:hypothetical protein
MELVFMHRTGAGNPCLQDTKAHDTNERSSSASIDLNIPQHGYGQDGKEDVGKDVDNLVPVSIGVSKQYGRRSQGGYYSPQLV